MLKKKKKKRLLCETMCKRGAPSMFNFLQTAGLIHLRPGQRTVSTEVSHRRDAESRNTLQRELFRVEESRQSKTGEGKEERTS